MESVKALCSDLMRRTTHFVDRRDLDSFMDLFHLDAVIHTTNGTLSGHAEIRHFMERRDTSRVTRHVLGPAVIFLEGDEARGIADFVFYDGPADANPPPVAMPVTVGEYHQEYRRGPDGWRIASHRIVPIFHGKA